MRRTRKPAAWALLAMMAFQAVCAPETQAKDLFQMLFHMQRPATGVDPSVEQLAEQIDWLEKHIDAYGSVAAKQPDVWGQARLTKHRQEYENEMYQQLKSFDAYLQGTISQSDQAFLANAFTLQSAASSPAPNPSTRTRSLGLRGPGNSTTLQFASSTPVASGTNSSAPAPKPSQPATSSLIGDPDAFFGNPMGPFPATNFALSTNANSNKIGIEPTIALEQRDRYLNYLHTLRRRNEGDDTADSPGYALNLVRIPISVLPGKRTHRGYGAEITVTARPYLSPALLPVTFRHLVINDVVDQLALPITRVADEQAIGGHQSDSEEVAELRRELAYLQGIQKATEDAEARSLRDAAAAPANRKPYDAEEEDKMRSAIHQLYNEDPSDDDEGQKTLMEVFPNETPGVVRRATKSKKQVSDTKNRIANLQQRISSLATQKSTTAVNGPASRLRQARNAIPPTQVRAIFGAAELSYIARQFSDAYTGPNVRWNEDGKNKHVMYLDVRQYLQSEVEAAYELVARQEAEALWLDPGFNVPELAEAIVAGRSSLVCRMRENFYRTIEHTPAQDLIEHTAEANDCDEQVVKSLAWAIIVESALLNRRLIDDMRDSAQTKGCGCMSTEGMQFYLPRPDPAACEAFNAYVQCRWPIHVFALDPSIQEQNIGSAFSRRRELQLAMALGFVQGSINANDMMKFSRRIETEIQTVDLNETQVGFSHGGDTFGWRFYPRVQAPPIPGTLVAFGQTLFGGPCYDSDIVHRKLEPGMRECIALVIMPSFVSQLTLETRADWIRLNGKSGWLPTKHKREITMVDTMKLSRSVKSMHDMAAQVCDSGSYRAGDVQLLMNRVHQLDRQLPLQGMMVQVPIENTLGGYQMFDNGVTDLAPELHGWYGAPGIALWKDSPPPASQGCSACNTAPAKDTGSPTPAPDASAKMAGAMSSSSSNATKKSAGTGGTASPSDSKAAGDPATESTKLAAQATKLAADTVSLAGDTLKLATDAAKAAVDPKPKKPSAVPLPPDCCCSGTTVFLVGNHFSTHDTRVIAGGMCVPGNAVTLLSRQVMQVTIPWNAQTVTIEKNEWVDVHVATPYGVTGHLHIPAFNADKPAEAKAPDPIATAISPLQVQLGDQQELVVKYRHDVDFAIDDLALKTKDSIDMHCLDKDFCEATKSAEEYGLFAVIYHGNDEVGKTTEPISLSISAAKGTLSVTSKDLWTPIAAVLKDPNAPNQWKVQQALDALYRADPKNVALSVHLFLRTDSGPDLHVIGELPLKFEETKSRSSGDATPNPRPAGPNQGEPTPATSGFRGPATDLPALDAPGNTRQSASEVQRDRPRSARGYLERRSR